MHEEVYQHIVSQKKSEWYGANKDEKPKFGKLSKDGYHVERTCEEYKNYLKSILPDNSDEDLFLVRDSRFEPEYQFMGVQVSRDEEYLKSASELAFYINYLVKNNMMIVPSMTSGQEYNYEEHADNLEQLSNIVSNIKSRWEDKNGF